MSAIIPICHRHSNKSIFTQNTINRYKLPIYQFSILLRTINITKDKLHAFEAYQSPILYTISITEGQIKNTRNSPERSICWRRHKATLSHGIQYLLKRIYVWVSHFDIVVLSFLFYISILCKTGYSSDERAFFIW